MNRSARPRAHWRWRPLLPPKKTDANATFHFLRENRHQGSTKTNVSRGEGMGASCAGSLGRGAFPPKAPPFPQQPLHAPQHGRLDEHFTHGTRRTPSAGGMAGRGFRVRRLRPHRLLRTARRVQRTGGPDIQLGLASGYPRIRHPAHDRGLAPAVRLRPAPELASRGRRGLCHTGRRKKTPLRLHRRGHRPIHDHDPHRGLRLRRRLPACPRRPRGRGERFRPLLALRSPDARPAHPPHDGSGHGFSHADEGKGRPHHRRGPRLYALPNAGLPRAPRLPALAAYGGHPRFRARRGRYADPADAHGQPRTCRNPCSAACGR